MAKLYWRIKRAGKWTWIAATSENTQYSLHREAAYYDGKELCFGGRYIEDDDAVVEKPEIYLNFIDRAPGEEE